MEREHAAEPRPAPRRFQYARRIARVPSRSRPRWRSTVGSPCSQSRSEGENRMTLSDSFRKLADQIDAADANVKAAQVQDKADLKASVDAARKSADKQSAELRAKAEEASQRAKSGWQEVQDDWDAHVQRLRQRI